MNSHINLIVCLWENDLSNLRKIKLAVEQKPWLEKIMSIHDRAQ